MTRPEYKYAVREEDETFAGKLHRRMNHKLSNRVKASKHAITPLIKVIKVNYSEVGVCVFKP